MRSSVLGNNWHVLDHLDMRQLIRKMLHKVIIEINFNNCRNYEADLFATNPITVDIFINIILLYQHHKKYRKLIDFSIQSVIQPKLNPYESK